MSDKEGPIAQQFHADDMDRQTILQRARLCAALADPALLPPKDQSEDQKLPENYQSVGSQGMLNMEGKMLTALFPVGAPWFHLQVAPEIRYAPDVDTAQIQTADQALFLRELAMQSVLESANLSGSGDRGGKIGFRTAKRMALAQILVTGETLEQLTDDYRLKVFGRDSYVTRRDPCGDVIYHIVKETIDPLSLSPKVLAKAALEPEKLRKKAVKERLVDLFTQVEWMPMERHWRIRQEINGKRVAQAIETISPYFCTPFRLAPKEHYGRGFIELNLGDLRTLNESEHRLLELLNLMSLGIIAKDYSSETRDEDLKKESGRVIQARVQGGKLMDVALVKFDGVNEARALSVSIEVKTKRLGKAMLMESDSAPTGERVTAYQISRIAQELEGILGGAYTPIADMQQQPLIRRLEYQMVRDRLLPPLPKGIVKVNTLTGAAAIVRAARRGGVVNLVQAAVALGPTVIARIDEAVLLNVLARYENIDEPGLIKSDARMAQDQKAALGAQAAQQAIEQAVKSTGAIAEQKASQGNALAA